MVANKVLWCGVGLLAVRHVLSEHPPLPLREWADRGGALKRLALSEDQREALLKELKTDALSDAQVCISVLLLLLSLVAAG